MSMIGNADVTAPLPGDAEAEIRQLRGRLSTLTEEAANNEAILRRSHEREMELLQAESLPRLLHQLVRGLADSYGLHRVTLVLCDPQHEVRHLLTSEGQPVSDFEDVLFVDTVHGLAPQFVSFGRPWLGPYMGSDHQLIFPNGSNLRSVALMPLVRQQRLMGSLNFGSTDAHRFTRHHATDFLHHLATITAFCLENAVNRARLVRVGLTDVLTGWYNRRYLQSRMREELARAQRERRPIVCLMVDVDHFKAVNDRFGHMIGDQVLRELAQRIDSQIRASDVAARYGGEEFAILLPATELRSGLLLAERIRATVSETPIDLGNSNAQSVTVSIGAAECLPPPGERDYKTVADALLAQADVALYQAKADGRDRVSPAPGD